MHTTVRARATPTPPHRVAQHALQSSPAPGTSGPLSYPLKPSLAEACDITALLFGRLVCCSLHCSFHEPMYVVSDAATKESRSADERRGISASHVQECVDGVRSADSRKSHTCEAPPVRFHPWMDRGKHPRAGHRAGCHCSSPTGCMIAPAQGVLVHPTRLWYGQSITRATVASPARWMVWLDR